MTVEYEVRIFLALEVNQLEGTSKHANTDVMLIPPPNQVPGFWQDPHTGDFTKAGSNAVTTALIAGLACNLHYADQHGFRDREEYLRHIIAELHRLAGWDATTGIIYRDRIPPPSES